MKCVLGSECEDISSPGQWYHYGLDHAYTVFDSSRRKRCKSCGNLIDKGEHCNRFGRFRYPLNDIEERICGDEVRLSDGWLCEKCTDIIFNLEDMGFEVCGIDAVDALDRYREYLENTANNTIIRSDDMNYVKSKTAKQHLVDFVKMKRDTLQKYLPDDLHYCDDEDIADIESWTEEECKSIILQIRIYSDRYGCAWCMKIETSSCDPCGYGTRHGICSDRESNYLKIINKKPIREYLLYDDDFVKFYKQWDIERDEIIASGV